MSSRVFKVTETERAFTLKDGNDDLEPSAVEAIDERFFLVADDKGADLFVVETETGKVLNRLKLPDGFKKPKWEAMAFDGEHFYIIGSHAVKLDDPVEKSTSKLAARSRLLRFKLKNTDGAASEIKIDSDSIVEMNVSDSLKLAGLYDADPFRNKVKIEGLAVRNGAGENKELIFALREPHDLMHIFRAELPEKPKSGERLALNPFFTFEAGRIGMIPFRLSSIEHVPEWSGFFILTSTEDPETNEFFGNALWFVSDEQAKNSAPPKLIVPQVVMLFAVDMKAEGLCLLPGATDDALRLALVFDNDSEDTEKEGKMQVIEISRK